MYSRHDLVWLSARGWDAALATAETHHAETMARWRDGGWPLIVTRRHAGASPDALCLGLSAPSQDGGRSRMRIALKASKADVARHQSPPLLAQVIDHAPPHWRTGLANLERHTTDLQLHVYGSLALQALTHQQYLRQGSDVDLLFEPRNREQLVLGIDCLERSAIALPLDGEIVFPGGAAVAWKEWRGDPARVLVKHSERVYLAPPAMLMESLTS